MCGPPASGVDPNSTYGFPSFNQTAYGLNASFLEPDLPAYNASTGTPAIVPSYYGTAMDGREEGAVPGGAPRRRVEEEEAPASPAGHSEEDEDEGFTAEERGMLRRLRASGAGAEAAARAAGKRNP
jgi:hypothetical protein